MITKVVIYLAILALPLFALSQGPDGASANSSPSSSQLPDAPAPRSGRIPEISDRPAYPSSAEQEPDALPQTKRILGVVPNFRSVDADTRLRPQTVKEKFSTGLQDSFDYSSFIFAAAQAGAAQATNGYPAFRQGAAGFGRYYWHTFVDQADENLWVESFIPSALHEDDRYYTLGHGGVFSVRGMHSVEHLSPETTGEMSLSTRARSWGRYCCWHIICVLPGRIPCLDEDRSTLADKYCLG